MSNVLSEEKKQQVIALGKLGWPLRRIEQATGVRRETASAYLKSAGVVVCLPGTERVCPGLIVEPLAGDEIRRAGWLWGAAKMLTAANIAKTVLPKDLPSRLIIGVDSFSALMDWLHYGLRLWNAGPV
jgi:hypothetical protein